MKKTVLSVALLLAGTSSGVPLALAQTPAQPAPQAAPAPQQKKEIKDPAEYNAYVGAVQQTDPAAKISGLEAFLTQYPNSVMKEDALELLMGAYQQTGNVAKMGDAAKRLLAALKDNISKYEANFGPIKQTNDLPTFPMNFGGTMGEA